MTLFPGGVAVSRLRVYDGGGTPHVHLACTEGYVVVGGRGAVETLTSSGAETVPLAEGTVVWFSPGTIHRLVNEEGLDIVVVMQNDGLPEAGDAVLTFPMDHLRDRAAYDAVAVLPPRAGHDAAHRRRALALEGYETLRREPDALVEFYRRAVALVHDRVADWRHRWRRGPAAASATTDAHLDALDRLDIAHLLGAGTWPARESEPRLGFCGQLAPYSTFSGGTEGYPTGRETVPPT